MSIDGRTVLVGMNNPYGTRPEMALWPAPERCAGWNLWRMLADYADQHHGISILRHEYIRAFDRRNLLSATTWSQKEARAAAAASLGALAGRRVVVLGAATAGALGLGRGEGVGHWQTHHLIRAVPRLFDPEENGRTNEPVADRFDYVCLPHPSGRCREYNDPGVRELAGRILFQEFRRGVVPASEDASP